MQWTIINRASVSALTLISIPAAVLALPNSSLSSLTSTSSSPSKSSSSLPSRTSLSSSSPSSITTSSLRTSLTTSSSTLSTNTTLSTTAKVSTSSTQVTSTVVRSVKNAGATIIATPSQSSSESSPSTYVSSSATTVAQDTAASATLSTSTSSTSSASSSNIVSSSSGISTFPSSTRSSTSVGNTTTSTTSSQNTSFGTACDGYDFLTCDPGYSSTVNTPVTAKLIYTTGGTGPLANGTYTYTPPYIFDNEPLSCYPDYVLQTTPPPDWGWAAGYGYNSLIFNNRCFTWKSNGCKDWAITSNGIDGCTVRPGEVELIYFKTTSHAPNATITAPPLSTLYDPHFDFTFTSPSVYIMYQRIDAWQDCNGPNKLGPHLTSAFFPYDLKDISTLVAQEGQLTGKRQLTLADIQASSCSTIPYDQEAAWSDTLPPATDTSYRCYPRIAIPTNVVDFGQPWWHGCQLFNPSTGIIDPPYALSIAQGLDAFSSSAPQAPATVPGTALLQTSPTPFVQPTTAPVPVNTPAPVVPVNTGSAPSPTPDPVALPPANNSPTPPDSGSTLVAAPPTNNDPTPGSVGTPVNQPAPVAGNSPPAAAATSPQAAAGNSPAAGAPQQDPGNPDVAVAVDDGSSPSQPGASNPDTKNAAPASNPAANAGGDPNSNSGSNNPSPAGVPVAGNGVSNSGTTPLPDKVVYKSLTLQQGGPVATISSLNAVVTYGTNGVIVQYPHGNVTSVPIILQPTLATSQGIGAVINSFINGSPAQAHSSTFLTALPGLTADRIAPSPSPSSGDTSSSMSSSTSGSIGSSSSSSSSTGSSSTGSSIGTTSTIIIGASGQPTTQPGLAHRSRSVGVWAALALDGVLLVLLL